MSPRFAKRLTLEVLPDGGGDIAFTEWVEAHDVSVVSDEEHCPQCMNREVIVHCTAAAFAALPASVRLMLDWPYTQYLPGFSDPTPEKR